MNPKVEIVTFGGRRWLKITPINGVDLGIFDADPWIKGYRPASTLRPLGAA